MKIAIIGSTGMVGREILRVISERELKFDSLFLVASKKSVGKSIVFQDSEHTIIDINTCLNLQPDLIIFSAGSELSLSYAPKFAKIGATVIDNSSVIIQVQLVLLVQMIFILGTILLRL